MQKKLNFRIKIQFQHLSESKFLEVAYLAASYKCTYAPFAFKNLRLSPFSEDNVHS